MTIWERAALPLNGVAAGLFGFLSALRGKRVFHPDGVAYSATLAFLPEDQIDPLLRFAAGTSVDAVVRFSRGLGLPQKMPDFLGLAIKLRDLAGPGRDQDFLLVTSGNGPIMQRLLTPARGFFRHYYSTLLPYRPSLDGEQILFGAKPGVELQGWADETFGDIAAAAAAGRLKFDFLAARVGARWKIAGSLTVTSRIEQDAEESLRFNPWNSHPSLIPAGPLNTWRKSSYEKSQNARQKA
ncbi:MAG TPA: hypothetical protein VHJ19_09430 [Gammaproteobacteria bacterium]|jgi:hypothetical protein|nr:hypothetical protein [Pseudomonadota bacterium]HEX2238539.1 hypothetical protein [Gammaproteobacteria bacterium]